MNIHVAKFSPGGARTLNLHVSIPEILRRLGADLIRSATGDHEIQSTPGDNMQHVYQRWPIKGQALLFIETSE